jgi:hypothetical protein
MSQISVGKWKAAQLSLEVRASFTLSLKRDPLGCVCDYQMCSERFAEDKILLH